MSPVSGRLNVWVNPPRDFPLPRPEGSMSAGVLRPHGYETQMGAQEHDLIARDPSTAAPRSATL